MILGIELGSTRIKSVLIDNNHVILAEGAHEWENRLENGVWTYHTEDVWEGIADSYNDMKKNYKEKTGETITSLDAIGISAMMHGYMPFDKADNLLVPFRTWRNTITGQASEQLTKLLNFHIPQRWSIAHLHQAVLNNEEHIKDIKYITTLAGYVHKSLTGVNAVGIGEASGMFPIDSSILDYDKKMLADYNKLIEGKNLGWKIEEVLPKVLVAGDDAGTLSIEGAKLLDKEGDLQAGAKMCPPEGDAGTGMVATNSVRKKTGNVSAGTSIFGMVVLEEQLKNVYDAIDLVTTPDGAPVAMAHCNNCTSEINAWVNIFEEYSNLMGTPVNRGDIYTKLFTKALEGDKACKGMMAYNYHSGEHITGFDEGRPLFMRCPDADFGLANFMRTQIYTSFGALKTGFDILFNEENVKLDLIFGHGGLFKTKGVGQNFLAAALNTKVALMESAGEGGAYGIALLAAYMMLKEDGQTLPDYMESKVFNSANISTVEPDPADVAGFNTFAENYKNGLKAEREAVNLCWKN